MANSKQSQTTILSVFDFDDTLVKTDAIVFIKHLDGTSSTLSPALFARYSKRRGDEFDFSEFDQLINPRPITKVLQRLKRAVEDGHVVVVLSARSSPRPITKFMKMVGVRVDAVVALGTVDPKMKAKWIKRAIREHKPTHVQFFDDAPKNIEHVRVLALRHASVRFRFCLV